MGTVEKKVSKSSTFKISLKQFQKLKKDNMC